jgi:hypothetical protein
LVVAAGDVVVVADFVVGVAGVTAGGVVIS